MEVGRELDKLVAEKVFGYEVVQHNQIGRPDWFYKDAGALILLPQYSKHIASAWLVVEKITGDLECAFGLGLDEGAKDWIAQFNCKNEFFDHREVRGQSAPHAICLAALKAVGTRTP